MSIILFSNINTASGDAQFGPGKLRIIILRHGEKPAKGDNLSCQGLNRAMLLPALIKNRFGIPDFVFVPAMSQRESTLHARMFQTVTPLVVKFNLTVNTSHAQDSYAEVADDLLSRKGTVLMVWEHRAIAPIVKKLGVKIKDLTWPDDDYDSIWVITFPEGVPTLTIEKEGLKPSADCAF